MKKFKRNTLFRFFLFSLLVALGLTISTTFGNVLAENSTELNETTATVKVVLNDETNYYASFSDAIDNLQNNSAIILLKDASLCKFSNIICSIDLNGKTISGKTQISYCDLTILDSLGSGKISGSQTFYSSNITIQSAGMIENFMLTDRSTATILGGTINKINANGNSLNVCGGEINNLCIYADSIHLSGGTINNFRFIDVAENFEMLNEGYIYSNKTDNSPIKTADMTSSTPVTIIKCTHLTFTDSVCDYCSFVCEHNGHFDANGVCQLCGFVCSHENHFNSDGICEICNYVCPHLELNDNNVCLKCNQEIGVN